MNKDYEVYQAPEAEVPQEDKARLDGYLRGRAEAIAVTREIHKRGKMAPSIKTKKRK